MPRVATKLTPTASGGFMARKIVPTDVKHTYAERYGRRVEERLNTGPMSINQARIVHREWSSEIETRITNIRAAKTGDGQTLTVASARALSGVWYQWFIAREADRWPTDVWEGYRERMFAEVEAAAIQCGVFAGEPLDLFEGSPEIRERVRPIIADEAKTKTFLAAKRMTLNAASRTRWLDFVVRDFFAAVTRLTRRARGDHGPDKHAEQFPAPAAPTSDSGLTIWNLFEQWIEKFKPAVSTVDRWRSTFMHLRDAFPDLPAAALLPEQAQDWARGLVTEKRSAITVSTVWIASAQTVFAWAVREKLIASNPFEHVEITVPRRKRNRETKAFNTNEVKIVLTAASKVDATAGKLSAAKRWCPWIAAYNGARMGELTQLRASDVIEQDGVCALKLSPEAGTTKSGTARLVPIHEHLIAQGFLDFVKASGNGPLFYNAGTPSKSTDNDPTNPKRTRAVKQRNKLAEWVRGLGVDDPELQPNHGWRHTFKAAAFRCGMTEKVIDSICGHAPATTGRTYGEPTLSDKNEALKLFPRYTI